MDKDEGKKIRKKIKVTQREIFHKVELPKSYRDFVFGKRGYKTIKITIENIDWPDRKVGRWFTYKHPDRNDDFSKKLMDLLRLDDDLLNSIEIKEIIRDGYRKEDTTLWHLYNNKLGGGRKRGPTDKTKEILEDWYETQEYYEMDDQEKKLKIEEFVEDRKEKYPGLTIDRMKYYLSAHSDYYED